MEFEPSASLLLQTQSYGYDCALSKEELRPAYNILFAPHLTQNIQPK